MAETPPIEPESVAPLPPISSAPWYKYAAKFVTAVIGVIVLAASQGLIEGTTAKWIAIVVSVLTAAGVYVVPNSG